MADLSTDSWIPACDLCGSLRHRRLRGAAPMLRCLDCGLISVLHETRTQRPASDARMSDTFAVAAIEALNNSVSRAVLVIGPASPAITNAVRRCGASMTVLVDTPGLALPDAVVRTSSLESISFAPDSFDLVIVRRGLETFASPSLLFDRASRWLVPGGSLLFAALNADSLPARLRRRWPSCLIATAEHLLSARTVGDYADRFGFTVAKTHSRAHTRDVATFLTGSERPAWLAEMASAPVALASALFGMGTVLAFELRRGGFAMRPARRLPEEAAEGAPGLAPALFTGAYERALAE